MTDAPDILETAQEALEIEHGTLTALVHGLARAVVELTARRGDEREWADVAKRTLESFLAREPEVAALREVERAARELCERLETNDRSADKIGRAWISEGTLREALAALDELRGGTGE